IDVVGGLLAAREGEVAVEHGLARDEVDELFARSRHGIDSIRRRPSQTAQPIPYPPAQPPAANPSLTHPPPPQQTPTHPSPTHPPPGRRSRFRRANLPGTDRMGDDRLPGGWWMTDGGWRMPAAARPDAGAE